MTRVFVGQHFEKGKSRDPIRRREWPRWEGGEGRGSNTNNTWGDNRIANPITSVGKSVYEGEGDEWAGGQPTTTSRQNGVETTLQREYFPVSEELMARERSYHEILGQFDTTKSDFPQRCTDQPTFFFCVRRKKKSGIPMKLLESQAWPAILYFFIFYFSVGVVGVFVPGYIRNKMWTFQRFTNAPFQILKISSLMKSSRDLLKM